MSYYFRERLSASAESVLSPGSHVLSVPGRFWGYFKGDVRLTAELDIPDDFQPDSKFPAVVITSGILYPRTNGFTQRLRRLFRESGFIVETFDYAGLSEFGGKSTGPLESHTLGQMTQDLGIAVGAMNDRLKNTVKDLVFVGPSAGGNAVATLLQRPDLPAQLKAAIFLGTPNDFLSFRNLYEPKTEWGEDRFGTYHSSSGTNKRIPMSLWFDSVAGGMNIVEPENISLPMLVVGGGDDSFCPQDSLIGINDDPRSVQVIIPGADHNMTGKDEALIFEMIGFMRSVGVVIPGEKNVE